jgi:uncharacterized protein (TIGR02678 family)
LITYLSSYVLFTQQDGDEQDYMTERGDVLYRIRRSCLAAMLCATRNPSSITATSVPDRLRQMTEQVVPESEEARNRSLRWSITRRLLDDPVMYVDDLGEQEKAYLETQRPTLVRRVAEAAGLVPEVRREGIAMADDRGDLTDSGIIEAGTDGHMTMLVAECLARARIHNGAASVPFTELAAHVADARAEFGQHWRQDAREPGSESQLARDAVDRLVSLRLAAVVPEGVTPLPAIGRYRGNAPMTSGAAGEERG